MPTPGPSPTTSPAELRRMIGGMLVVGFRGLTVADTDPVARAIAEDGLGGVVLFDRDQLTGKPRNIASPSQLRDLTASLRALAPDGKLFVAVDQEGGRVARLTPATGFPPTVSEAELGQQDDPDVAFAAGRRTATTLRDAGIDWNFAPVVDLDVNPDNPSIGALGRSFSADPAVVVAMATQVIRAHRELGVLTTLKHYPGLGSATGDTDREFVDVSRTWTPRELGPFRDLVAAGLADSVMAANAFNRQLDASHPASLSHATVTRSLRRDLGFGGPVVTDDLQAGAIRDRYSDADAIELAIAAGCDVLVLANQQVYVAEVARHTIDIVVNLVRRGRVTEHRIAASLERIAAARASIGG
jgi:beta-N-acetylhexosaminidase